MSPELKQALLDWAEVADAHRVVPKFLMGWYLYIVWDTTAWFKGLGASAAGEQQWLVQTVWGVLGLVTTFYFQTGFKWGQVHKEQNK